MFLKVGYNLVKLYVHCPNAEKLLVTKLWYIDIEEHTLSFFDVDVGSYNTWHLRRFLDTLTPRIVRWSSVTHLVGITSIVYMVDIARVKRSASRPCATVGAESNSLYAIGLAGEVYNCSKVPALEGA